MMALAVFILQQVQPINRVESTLKEALELLYANATELTGLTENETEQIREIARRCPLDDGFGVYMARAALLKVDTFPRNYTNECELARPLEERRDKTQSIDQSDQFTIYPNPSNGNLTLEYQLKDGEEGRIEGFDLMGKCILNKKLADNGTMNFTIDNVSSGLYTIRVIVDDEIRLSQKLSVLIE